MIVNSSTPTSDTPLKPRVLALTFVLMALLVPWLTLTWVGLLQFDSWPAVAVPFAMGRILIAHLLASLPMGMWIAWRTHRLGETRWIAIALALVGVLLAGISLLIAGPLGDWSVGGQEVRSFMVRSVWVLTLQLPWCFAAVVSLEKAQRQSVPFWADVVTALLLMAIPAVYTLEVVRRQSKLVEDAIVNQQYRKALDVTGQLYVLRTREIAGQDTAQLLTDLSADVRALSQAVQQPLPDDPTIDQVLGRARQLYGLGEYDAVPQVLGSLSQTDPRASYRLARGLEAQGKWTAAAGQYQATIRMIATASEEAQSSAALNGTLRSSYERLVNNLRRAGEYAAAESELKNGLENWPDHRDLFLLQLGFHYQLAGRTVEALDYFQQAGQANPQMQPIVEQQLSNLNRQAEGCLLRSPQAATR